MNNIGIDEEAMRTVMILCGGDDPPTPEEVMAALVYPARSDVIMFSRPISWLAVANTIADKIRRMQS